MITEVLVLENQSSLAEAVLRGDFICSGGGGRRGGGGGGERERVRELWRFWRENRVVERGEIGSELIVIVCLMAIKRWWLCSCFWIRRWWFCFLHFLIEREREREMKPLYSIYIYINTHQPALKSGTYQMTMGNLWEPILFVLVNSSVFFQHVDASYWLGVAR